MNAGITGVLFAAAIVAGCVFIPPAAGILVEWSHDRYGKAAGANSISLRQSAADYCRNLFSPDVEPAVPLTGAFLCLVFNLLAICLLALQQNLLPVVFLQGFGVLSRFVGEMSGNRITQKRVMDQMMKDFFSYQPVLLAVTVGFFYSTGSFTIADSLLRPKFLVMELPFIFIAVYAVLWQKLETRDSA